MTSQSSLMRYDKDARTLFTISVSNEAILKPSLFYYTKKYNAQ